MLGNIYDRINDYGSVKISLAGPNDIRSWSFGEVRKPETINYRTYRPEKDGLFCERIFGPERDWECACGKYKGTKFKGIICNRCGVKVTHSRVRRKRMGHINLAAPVVHIWFFKSIPNHLGTLLAMKTADLEKIIYFQDYVVTDPGQSPLKLGQLLSEEEFREASNKYGSSFKASMGAEAIKALLANLDLDATSSELRIAIAKSNSKQKVKDLTKRLKTVDAIKNSNNKPGWMVLEVIPVIPPDLRPLVLLESGNFATSDLNDLYRRIINRNNRLKKLIDLNAPDVIIRNEKRMLQQAVDSLLDNGRCRRPVLGSNNRPLKSLTDMIKGKQGRFRENLLGKRVDYSARSVIVVGPNLKLYQCGLPKKIALELYQPFIIRKLKQHGLADTIKSAKRMIERRGEQVWDVLEEVIHQHPVLLNRAPTLHRMGIQSFEPILVEGNAIILHPLACKGFNADFDGDQMAVHLPLSVEAQAEAHTLMMTSSNIFSPANGSPMVGPSQDMVMGNYYLTCVGPGEEGAGMCFGNTFEAIMAHKLRKVSLHAEIKVRIDGDKKVITEDSPQEQIAQGKLQMANGDKRIATVVSGKTIETTIGRCVFNDILPRQMPFYNMTMSQTRLSRVISDCFKFAGSTETVQLLDEIKDLGFKYATLSGMSFGITDLKIPEKKTEIIAETEKKVSRIRKNYQAGVLTEGERYNQVVDAWTHARVAVTNEMMRGLSEPIEEECEFDESGAGYALRVGIGNRDKFFKKEWESVILQLRNPVDGVKDVKVEVKISDSFWGKCCELRHKEIGKWLLRLLKKGFVTWTKGNQPKFLMVREGFPWPEGKRPKFLVVPEASAQLLGVSREKAIEVKAWSNKKYLNPIYLMSDSGARGSVDQIQQLAGMRALMAKPSGEIIETPIKSNFREGLSVLEYFSSTHGARKGLADTALKTANSGYLTRKLIDVAQNLIVTERDCGTLQGITKSTVSRGEQIDVPLSQLIIGRTARDNIRNPITDEMIVRENEVITPQAAAEIEALGLDAIRVRSPLTCDSTFGVCAKCYGWDLSTGKLVEEGLAVGIVAAQSIGEPGTQLTLRTFHTGGIASRAILESDQKATHAGIVQYRDLNAVKEPSDFVDKREKPFVIGKIKRKDKDETPERPVRAGRIALKRNGEIAILDGKGRELEKYKVPYGAHILKNDGDKIESGKRLFWWDPHRTLILAEVPGIIRFVDIVEGETIRVEEERKGQLGRPVVIEHKGDRHPQIIIESPPETSVDDKLAPAGGGGKILDVHYLPAGARIEVIQDQKVQAGQLLAHQPRAASGTQDITGGLPRVTEVFEARKPKDPAAMAEISGRVELRSDKHKGKMTIIIRSESGMEKEYHVPRDRHFNVHTGDSVEAGETLTDGPLVPHDILRIKGEEALQSYLTSEIQSVYRRQSVNINDKHIEIICAQMMRKVQIASVGDSSFLPGEVVDKFQFRSENERLAKSIKITNTGDATDLGSREAGALKVGQIVHKDELSNINEKLETIGAQKCVGRKPKPAVAETLLLGITKASLRSDSFIAAASFQQTTKVLTEASLAAKVDKLLGLKENVILGHLIPAGTSFKPNLEMKVKHLAEAPLPKEFEEVRKAKEVQAELDSAVKEALGID